MNRALLVTGAFAHEQFDRETDFLMAAKNAGLEAVVRISTASFLIHPDTQSAYGRAHHGIHSFAQSNDIPVVDINSDWFFSNWFSSAEEVINYGQITWPTKGNAKRAMIDTRDVASACALILTLPSADLKRFLATKIVEVHGPELLNFKELADIVSKALGYTITINAVPPAAWQKALEGLGIPRTFARSFLNTVLELAGDRPMKSPYVSTTSPLLTAYGWEAQYKASDWADREVTKAVFGH